MVNIVSQYKSNFPVGNASLKISMKIPLYTLSSIMGSANTATPWTRKCRNDALNLGFNNHDLFELLKAAVTTGLFKGSEWCEDRPGGNWAACDSYAVRRNEFDEETETYVLCHYFVKFCIADTGQALLTISCHL